MTTNTCRECSTRLLARNRAVGQGDAQHYCLACWECDDDLRHLNDEPVSTGRTNRSHAACDHVRTSAARARCRAGKA